MIHRRNLLGAGALGLAGAAAAFANPEKAADLAAPAIARNRRRFNMVTTWPKGLPGLGEAAERVYFDATRAAPEPEAAEPDAAPPALARQ